MSTSEVSEVSTVTDVGTDEVVVAVHDKTLLLGGDPAAVESYLARLRACAGHAVRVTGIGGGSVANAVNGLAGLASLLADGGKYVQVHRDSLDALKNGALLPGGDGLFRLAALAADGEFLAPLQWRPAGIGPEAMMSAQLLAVQMALKSAVAEVQDAVRRVEDKVGAVLEVARAHRAGDVLGNNLMVTRMVDSLERYGSLPDAYWDSVAALGPALNVTVEQLRNHVTRVLASFDHTIPVHQRAERLRNAIDDNRIGEALSLLVVAEESLHNWQRLNLARIESTQPAQLLRAIDEARELVDHHLDEDLRIYRDARDVLDRFGKLSAIDGFRFSSVRALAAQRCALLKEFDSFAKARHQQVESWERFPVPSVLDAAMAAVGVAATTTGQVIGALSRGAVWLATRLAEPLRGKDPDDGGNGRQEPTARTVPVV